MCTARADVLPIPGHRRLHPGHQRKLPIHPVDPDRDGYRSRVLIDVVEERRAIAETEGDQHGAVPVLERLLYIPRP